MYWLLEKCWKNSKFHNYHNGKTKNTGTHIQINTDSVKMALENKTQIIKIFLQLIMMVLLLFFTCRRISDFYSENTGLTYAKFRENLELPSFTICFYEYNRYACYHKSRGYYGEEPRILWREIQYYFRCTFRVNCLYQFLIIGIIQ